MTYRSLNEASGKVISTTKIRSVAKILPTQKFFDSLEDELHDLFDNHMEFTDGQRGLSDAKEGLDRQLGAAQDWSGKLHAALNDLAGDIENMEKNRQP